MDQNTEVESPVGDLGSDLEKYAQDQIYKMGLTSGSRYIAASRHKKRSLASVWAITILSMYVFSLSVYSSIFDLSAYANAVKIINFTNPA